MKHPERLNVYAWFEDHPMIWVLWLFIEALGIVLLVGLFSLIAHVLAAFW